MTSSQSDRPRAVLYVRLSKESAASTSIVGQNDDLTALAERNGWDVADVFTDNGKSGGTERAKAQAAFDMWRDGDADILVVYAYDRWSRMGIKTLASLIEVVDARAGSARPATFVAVREGIESTQPDWQLRAAFAADMAKRERDLVAARQIAARDRMRRQGRNAGHGLPGFGYRTGPHPSLPVGRGLHVIEHERAIVLEVADRLLADESVLRIAQDLNRRRVPTSKSEARRAWLAREARARGEQPNLDDLALLDRDPATLDTGRWTTNRISRAWTSEHMLGRLSHNRAPLYGADGAPLAPFEPILSLDASLAIRERFDGNRLGPKKVRAAGLLSGVLYCGGCDGKMYRKPIRGYVNYGCSATGSRRECPHPVTISGRRAEAFIVGQYLALMGETPEYVYRDTFDDSGASADLADMEARLREIAARMAATDDDEELDALTASLSPLRARRRALRDTVPTRRSELHLTGRTMAEAWTAVETDDERRALLLAVMYHATIHPASRADRVVIQWRERVADRGEGESRGPGHGPRKAPRAQRASAG